MYCSFMLINKFTNLYMTPYCKLLPINYTNYVFGTQNEMTETLSQHLIS